MPSSAKDLEPAIRKVIEASPTGMMLTDAGGRIVLANALLEQMFGYGHGELEGQPIEVLVPDRSRKHHPGLRAGFDRDPTPRKVGLDRVLYGKRRDGSELPLEIGLNPLELPQGQFTLSWVMDLTVRKRDERERDDLLDQLRELNSDLEDRIDRRTKELQEREVLLQEVHHRVKNNLQVISSLINMQMRKLTDANAKEAMEECSSRVQAIALLHEKLYQSSDYSQVPFSDYVSSLATSVLDAAELRSELSGHGKARAELVLEVEALSLGVDKAIPCGLVLNELITNALKHAFREGQKGTIKVEFGRAGPGRLRLAVGDDGRGLPQQVEGNSNGSAGNPSSTETLGMQLVHILADQLSAEIDVSTEAGTRFSFTFPVESP